MHLAYKLLWGMESTSENTKFKVKIILIYNNDDDLLQEQ